MFDVEKISNEADVILDGFATKKENQKKDKEVRIIQEFIKDNYLAMYQKWTEYSSNGFFGGK